MNSTQKKFLFDLLKTPSPTGYELAGQKVWAKEVRKYADKVENDAYGNAWATLKGTGKRSIMLEAHADEIGYVVKYINKEGFLSIDLIGGSDAATARGRFITLYGEKGEVPGIIGNIAIHLRDRKKGEETAPEVHELTVDIGAKDEKGVEKMGIRVGTPAVYSDTVREIGKNMIAGRAIDNRIGSFIIAEVLAHLAKKKLAWTVYAVNAVQEEIGGYGAKMVSHRLQPDLAIVFDVTHGTDTPGIKQEQHSKVEMNKGPTVTHGGCNHPTIVSHIMQAAHTKKIPLQHEAIGRYSGTDTGRIYDVRDGIPSALVSVPVRYMHSPVEMIDLRDVDRAIDLLTETVLSLKVKQEFGVRV